MTRREALLHVASLLDGPRAQSHGPAVVQLAHAHALKRHAGHRMNEKLSETELEAIEERIRAMQIARLWLKRELAK